MNVSSVCACIFASRCITTILLHVAVKYNLYTLFSSSSRSSGGRLLPCSRLRILFITLIRYKFQRYMIMAGELSLQSDMRLTKAVVSAPCALRSTQPLKMSSRDLSWGKGGRCVWLMTYHPCSAETSRNPGP